MFDNYLSGGLALLGAFLSWFLGGLDGLMGVLLVFIVCDLISGMLKGIVLGQFSSDVGFNGIARKVYIVMIVGIANVLDNELLSKLLGHSEALRDGVITFYIANEGLSILENAIDMDLPVPEFIKQWFLSWHQKQLAKSGGSETSS